MQFGPCSNTSSPRDNEQRATKVANLVALSLSAVGDRYTQSWSGHIGKGVLCAEKPRDKKVGCGCVIGTSHPGGAPAAHINRGVYP